MLCVEHINVFYGEIQALWDVSLTVNENKIIVLLGSNGAGKSTIVNAITGVMTIDSGTVKFKEEDIKNLSPNYIVEKGICQIAQERLIFSDMSVRENLELGGYIQRARSEIRQTLDTVYKIFPKLLDRGGQRAGSLSGGEQQMLAIARGLMTKPSVLILDEPSFGLAPLYVDEIFKIIKDINKQGVTVLLVEQNVYKALEVADYGYVLENGRIVMHDTGKELLKNSFIKKAYLGI